MSLKELLIFSVVIFSILSAFLVLLHEYHLVNHDKIDGTIDIASKAVDNTKGKENNRESNKRIKPHQHDKEGNYKLQALQRSRKNVSANNPSSGKHDSHETIIKALYEIEKKESSPDKEMLEEATTSTGEEQGSSQELLAKADIKKREKKGPLMCGNVSIDSEIIYWKKVPGDDVFESPVTPHHDNHHDRYLTFEYDNGGWNNMRMGIECLIVAAHAMGRTLVIPPQQHLYLLGRTHKDKHDTEAHDEMGFEDMYNIDLLRSHSGFHVIHMEEFLAKEGVTGGLHGEVPPHNSTEAWGRELWKYLDRVADVAPAWSGHALVMPSKAGDFTMKEIDTVVKTRLTKFLNGRAPIYYDENLQKAHHIHVPGDAEHRLLQHHYAFAFFADTKMQSFYKRFVRDYMRYKDEIQCAGHELVAALRKDSIELGFNGDYYALHIRRGDFQFKEVKLGASDILANLVLPNGELIIPKNALVYLSTDDPKGLCENCLVQRKPCESYPEPKPVGCPKDTSWNAFIEHGWTLRFLHDYTERKMLVGTNPNTYGMIESIVCSRAKAFAGTFFSTFTGYIHRLRGYHGLGESTYYHSPNKLLVLQSNISHGNGFSREYRGGWIDDDTGELI